MMHGLPERADGKRSRKALLGKKNEERTAMLQIILELQLHQLVLFGKRQPSTVCLPFSPLRFIPVDSLPSLDAASHIPVISEENSIHLFYTM